MISRLYHTPYIHTVFVRIEARASISFPGVLTWPLFEPGLYSSPASIKIFSLILGLVSNIKSVVYSIVQKRKLFYRAQAKRSALFGFPVLFETPPLPYDILLDIALATLMILGNCEV